MEEEKNQNTNAGEQNNDNDSIEEIKATVSQLREQLAEKDKKIQELEIEIDKVRASGESADEELAKVSAIRKERRRVEEQLGKVQTELDKYNQMIQEKKKDVLRMVVSTKLKEVGITDENKVSSVIDKLAAENVDPENQQEIEEKIKVIVPSVDVDGYWEARKKMAEQNKQTEEDINKNINAGSPSNSDSGDDEEDYTSEELKYAQQNNISPADARRILKRFSQGKRRLE